MVIDLLATFGGGWLLDLHIYIDGTSSRRSRNNGEIKMPQKFLGRSTETSWASSWQQKVVGSLHTY